MAGQEPLLSQRPSSEHSSDRGLAEEDALLSGEPQQRSPPRRGWKFYRDLGLFAWATIATALVIILAVVYQQKVSQSTPSPPSGKRNLIFMVSDGMGPTSMTMARSFQQYRDGLPWSQQLVLDQHLVGTSRTRSSSSLVTDSAAGATAFSCGFKSYNGAISVLEGHTPCGTVLEAAKRAGYMTGLVVTTRITDATPAVWASHVNMRSEEDRIAEQLIGRAHPLGRVVDLMIGGGRCHFLPNTTVGSCREDGTDVVGMAKEDGWQYVDDLEGFRKLKGGAAVDLPLLALVAETDVPYEIDRRHQEDVYPSLDAMANVALKTLSEATKSSDKGFFLMVEGSRIDHAGHANDPAAQVHEVLAYDKTIASVLEFLDRDPVQGVMVSTSDHETGGLATARQLHDEYPQYLWYPSVLANASHSASELAHTYHAELDTNPSLKVSPYLNDLVEKGFGITDPSHDEIQALVDSPDVASLLFADMVSRRAQTGWSTLGHSGADVNIYASDVDAARPLVGNHENTEVGDFLRDYLDLDLEPITTELNEKGAAMDAQHAEVDALGKKVSWMGRIPEMDERLDNIDHQEHYLGDFKKHKRCNACGI
ncbi:alkaline phosphatase-like protein [Eremomyces bilateralis CBS 781.70]|uniref:Alkaline phosphatase n=1 Tax=Eremomyces bilateralis CBS 781.70 TaxID=1392243 RepID=A0A6G1GF56_9PEZI|nr:alkaline phosphatase-like protein [Eremomyces bilateralis CBS 781.70]KAF1816632.1 alkaline phosphatase-like protein [Eremomyces bilateralis CBS 781.70]